MIDFRSGREPKSSSFDYIAIRIASTPPAPSMSEYRLDMSVSTPILILSTERTGVISAAVPVKKISESEFSSKFQEVFL